MKIKDALYKNDNKKISISKETIRIYKLRQREIEMEKIIEKMNTSITSDPINKF